MLLPAGIETVAATRAIDGLTERRRRDHAGTLAVEAKLPSSAKLFHTSLSSPAAARTVMSWASAAKANVPNPGAFEML